MAAPDGRGLEPALRSIRGQTSREEVEIVISASSPMSLTSFDLADHPDVVVLPTESMLLPGETRNRGLAAATSDFIAFIASDCVAEPGWVGERVRLHRAGYDAVAGSVTYNGRRTPWGLGAHFFLFGYRAPVGRDDAIVSFPDPRGHGLSMSRAIFERIGNFADDLRIGEDTDLYFRLGSESPVIFSTKVRCAHSASWTPLSVISDLYRRGRRRGELERQTALVWLKHDAPHSLAIAAISRFVAAERAVFSSEGCVRAILAIRGCLEQASVITWRGAWGVAEGSGRIHHPYCTCRCSKST